MWNLQVHTIVEHCVKNQHIWLRTLGEEAFGVTLPQVKIGNNRTVAVGWQRVGRLKRSSARANSATGLFSH